MSEASWTPNPVTERELAQVQRSGRVRRRLGWSLTMVSLGLCPFSGIAWLAASLREPTQGADIIALILLLATVVLGLSYIRRKEKDRWLRSAREARLAADYGDGAGWLVTLHVYQGAALTGIDRGLVWFEDDRLYFTGERTSFGLAADGVRGNVRAGGWVSSLTSNLNLPLTAHSEAGPVTLGLDVHEVAYGRMAQRTLNGLAEAVRGWQSASPKGEVGQIPPLVLGPEAPSAAVLSGRAAGITAFWFASALGLIALGLTQGWGFSMALMLVGATALVVWNDVWMPRRHWQAWRDRRRLEARR